MIGYPSITCKFDIFLSWESRCNFFVLHLSIFHISNNCHQKLQWQNFLLKDLKEFKITWNDILLMQKPTVGVGVEEIWHRKLWKPMQKIFLLYRTEQPRIRIPRAHCKQRNISKIDILKWCTSGLTQLTL